MSSFELGPPSFELTIFRTNVFIMLEKAAIGSSFELKLNSTRPKQASKGRFGAKRRLATKLPNLVACFL